MDIFDKGASASDEPERSVIRRSSSTNINSVIAEKQRDITRATSLQSSSLGDHALDAEASDAVIRTMPGDGPTPTVDNPSPDDDKVFIGEPVLASAKSDETIPAPKKTGESVSSPENSGEHITTEVKPDEPVLAKAISEENLVNEPKVPSDDHPAAGDLAEALDIMPTISVKLTSIKSSENEVSASGSHSSGYKISSEYGKQADLAKPDPSTEGKRQYPMKLITASELILISLYRTVENLQAQLLVSTKEPPHLGNQQPPHLENQQPKRTDTSSQSKNSQEATFELSIAHLTQEQFKPSAPSLKPNPERPGHSIAERRKYKSVIEVLDKGLESTDRTRYIAHGWSGEERASSKQTVPERVRICSPFLLDLLSHVTGESLEHCESRTSTHKPSSLVFLHPFKFFVIYAKTIVEATEDLEEKQSRAPPETYDSSKSGSLETSGEQPASAVKSRTDDGEFQSKSALEHLQLVTKLLKVDLKPILDFRYGYEQATIPTVTFENLWLLFSFGGLVYYREPVKDHPPALARVTSCNGGRRLLNNRKWENSDTLQQGVTPQPGENSKGKENRFYIRQYTLDFDGESYGPVENMMTMPAWAGSRNVHDLKVFPFQYCTPNRDFDGAKFPTADDYKAHLVERGKKFVSLGSIAHKRYDGHIVGTQNEQCNSHVVVDFALQRRDAKEKRPVFGGLFGLIKVDALTTIATGLSIPVGDLREIREGTMRQNDEVDCIHPGCDNNDFIHNDIAFDGVLAERQIEKYGLTGTPFKRDKIDEEFKADHYTLFPTFVFGYVFHSRLWAKLDLDLMTESVHIGSKFKDLQLPDYVKESLDALMHVGHYEQPSPQLPLDLIPGKGQGRVVLLHGPPGVGKTATAEAVAANMNRPLLPMSYADLGQKPNQIETRLKETFRYGRRWDCVLLLDEADVFLMKRDSISTPRNAIVSVFLRNLEWYPGIIFLTSNRVEQFDEGVLDRIHMKLHYPQLRKEFAKRLWTQHLNCIDEHYKTQQKSSSAEQTRKLSWRIRKPDRLAIEQWWEEQFKGKDPQAASSWNGRKIRNTFQMAMDFAEDDRRKENKENGSNHLEACIDKNHFDRVLRLEESFRTDLQKAKDGSLDNVEDGEQHSNDDIA